MKNMNKKGASVAGIITAFIVAIVALAFVVAIAGSSSTLTDSRTLNNVTYLAPAAESTIDLTGQELLSTPVVLNTTDGVVIPASNYTIFEGISPSTGVKTIRYTSHAGHVSSNVSITYTYGDFGYIDDSAGRSMVDLIVIFCALAVLAYVIWATGLWDDLQGYMNW